MKQELLIPSDMQTQFPILRNHSVLETIKCKDGSHGFYVCFQSSCQNYPFMCNSKKCTCRKDHHNCMKTEAQDFIQNLSQKVTNLSNLIQFHNETVDNFVQSITNDAKQLKVHFKDQVNRKCKELSFSLEELDILFKIQQNKVSTLKGADFFKVYSQLKLKKKDQYSYDQKKQMKQMKQMVQRWKIIQSKMLDQLQDIETTWKLNKNHKCLYTEYTLARSSIATTVKQYRNICDFFNKRIRLQLLYKASENDFKVTNFHKLCDNIPNTLVLILTQFNKKIGGFTPLKWQQNNSQVAQTLADKSKETFLFSLTHNQKLNQKNQKAGIANFGTSGPVFGKHSHYELYISQAANQSQKSGASFDKYEKCFDHPSYEQFTNITIQRFTGNPNNQAGFKIKEWQVWEVIFLE